MNFPRIPFKEVIIYMKKTNELYISKHQVVVSNIFVFSLLPGKMIQFDQYLSLSNGLVKNHHLETPIISYLTARLGPIQVDVDLDPRIQSSTNRFSTAISMDPRNGDRLIHGAKRPPTRWL